MSAEHWASLPSMPAATWERLGRMRVVLDTVLPCSPAEFHDHFLSEAAGFPASEFHHARGDLSITVTPWSETTSAAGGAADAGGGGGATAGAAKPRGSSHSSSSAASGPQRQHHHHGTGGAGGRQQQHAQGGDAPAAIADAATRTMRLRMLLEPHPLAPSETRVEKVQRYSQFGGRLLLVDTSARSLDIPYGDYFVTEDSWLVLPVSLPPPPPAGAAAAGGSGGGGGGGGDQPGGASDAPPPPPPPSPLKGLPPAPPADAVARARALLQQWGVSETAEDAPGGGGGGSGGSGGGGGDHPPPPPPPQRHPRLCRLVALVYVNFSKGTILKGTIVAKAEANIAKFQAEFAGAATRFLGAHYRSRALAAAAAAARGAGGAGSAASSSPAASARGGGGGGGAAPALSSRVHPQLAALRASPPALGGPNVGGGGGGAARSPSGSSSLAGGDFLSPTAAAAVANPALAIRHDELMASWLTPAAAARVPAGELLRAYTQLHAVHEAMLAQTRRLQLGAAARQASDHDAAAAAAAGWAPHPRPAPPTAHGDAARFAAGDGGGVAGGGGEGSSWCGRRTLLKAAVAAPPRGAAAAWRHPLVQSAVGWLSLGWLPRPLRALLTLAALLGALLARTAGPSRHPPLQAHHHGPAARDAAAHRLYHPPEAFLSSSEQRIAEAVLQRLQAGDAAGVDGGTGADAAGLSAGAGAQLAASVVGAVDPRGPRPPGGRG